MIPFREQYMERSSYLHGKLQCYNLKLSFQTPVPASCEGSQGSEASSTASRSSEQTSSASPTSEPGMEVNKYHLHDKIGVHSYSYIYPNIHIRQWTLHPRRDPDQDTRDYSGDCAQAKPGQTRQSVIKCEWIFKCI